MTDFLQDILAGYDDELYHHGILGQKWGVRRYQNKDGSLTEAGKKRYYTSELKDSYARYSKSKPAYDKATADYNKRVSEMMDHYDKAYTYNPKTVRLDENPAELKKARAIEEPIKKALMKYYDKDPNISQHYTDENGRVNQKEREYFWLDNMGEDFASNPWAFAEHYIAQTNPELHNEYSESRQAYLTAARSAFDIKGAKNLRSTNHGKMWLTDFMKTFEESERSK